MSATPQPRILVVDDERAVRSALSVNLGKQGFQVEEAQTAEEAIAALSQRPVDVVISDVAMPGMGGMALLEEIKKGWPEIRVVVMTGYGSVSDAVQAMKTGADDYIIKPVSKDALLVIIERALAGKALLAELVQLRQEVQDKYGFENLIGTTPAMLEVYEQIEAVADTNARVLLQGPTGTGKELIAHAVHYRSSRRNGPLVKVSCAALPEALLESELFGHEKGAFTGAVKQHRGKFEQANGGTLFLDEIGEISAATQVKLLRALESGEIQRLGGTETIRVDIRLVSATNRNLRTEVKEGRFREDLYYRLNTFTIAVPPLATRRDDIPLLVDHFVKMFCKENGRDNLTVSSDVLDQLMAHHWPGNVRELLHVVERAVILSRGEDLTGVKLPEALNTAEASEPVIEPGTTLQTALREHERRLLIAVLKESRGVQAEAARRIGISRSNLNYRIQRLGIILKDVSYE